MRQMYRQLTRQMLEDWGISSISWDADNNEWWIDRYWYKNNTGKKVHTRLAIVLAQSKRKYSQRFKSYKIVSWSYYCKQYCYPLARVIYAWFHDEVPEGYVVDHINNDPYDNRLANLQLLTQEDNLLKRYSDNPENWKNQYGK